MSLEILQKQVIAAIERNDSLSLRDLLKAGVSFSTGFDHSSLLRTALRNNALSCIDVLVEHGADLSEEITGGDNFLLLAGRTGTDAVRHVVRMLTQRNKLEQAVEFVITDFGMCVGSRWLLS